MVAECLPAAPSTYPRPSTAAQLTAALRIVEQTPQSLHECIDVAGPEKLGRLTVRAKAAEYGYIRREYWNTCGECLEGL